MGISGQLKWVRADQDQVAINQALGLLNQAGEVSRNRDFFLFTGPTDRRALLYYRLVKSIEAEAASCSDSRRFAASPHAGGMVVVRIENPALRYTRTTFLPQELFVWLAGQLERLGLTLDSTHP